MDKKTYRHRNTKNNTVPADLIHTFWVGQRVVRSGSRTAYVDNIDEEGTVVALPVPGSDFLIVESFSDGLKHKWYSTEATPWRVWAENQGKRLRSVAKTFSNHLAKLDENGFSKETEETS